MPTPTPVTIHGTRRFLPELAGYRVDTGKPYKVRREKTAPTTRLCIHESVTTSHAAADRVLRRRGLGVHVAVDPFGDIIWHNDPADNVAHASRFNGNSIGIEVINGYYAEHAAEGQQVIDAKWPHKGKYAVPPLEQMFALVALVDALTEREFRNHVGSTRNEVNIPLAWPGLSASASGDRRMCMTALPALSNSKRDSGPGVWAHGYTEHADGFFPVLVCYLALRDRWYSDHIQIDVEGAYKRAIELATGAGRWVTV